MPEAPDTTPAAGLDPQALRRAAEGWVAAGIIDREQADRIVATQPDAHALDRVRSSNRLIVALSLIGAFMVGAGVVTFIAANWQAMADWTKMALLVGTMLVVYAAGYYLSEMSDVAPRVGHALIFMGAILYGATIILYCQTYNIAPDERLFDLPVPLAALLVYAVGLLPLAYLLGSAPVILLSVFFLWAWSETSLVRFIQDTSAGTFSEGMTAYTAIILIFFSGLIVWALARLHELSAATRRFRPVLTALAAFSMLATFFGANIAISQPVQETDIIGVMPQTFAPYAIALNVAAALLISLHLYLRSRQGGPAPGREDIYPALAVFLSGWMMVFVPPGGFIVILVYSIAYFGVVAAFITYGYRERLPGLVNIGLLFLLAGTVLRFFDTIAQLLPRALALIVGGLVLVYGAYLLERYRRRLLQGMEEAGRTGGPAAEVGS